MATTSDVRVGTIVKHQGNLCQVADWQHTMPGKGGAFYQAKMKNLKTGKSVEYRYRSGESVELARIETRDYQLLYKESTDFVVMDKENYEQYNVPGTLFGIGEKFLQDGMDVMVSFESEIPIMAEAPTFVEAEITYTEPGVKGDTATNSLKPATVLENAEVRVPLFCEIGDKIKIDTRTGEYVSKIK
jgi:elongation factor P